MDFIRNWIETVRGVIFNPNDYFKSEDRKNGFSYPLKFALISLAVSSIISPIRFSLLYSELPSYYFSMNLILGVLVPLLGIIGIIFASIPIHIFVRLLGGEKSYSTTLSALEYSTAISIPAAIIGFVPSIGVGFYSIFVGLSTVFFLPLTGALTLFIGLTVINIQIKALKNFQELSSRRATIAVILPVVAIAVFVFLLFLYSLAQGAVY